MRWKRVSGQGDMEDRRGQSSPYGGGLPIPLPIGKAGGGLGLIVIVVLALLFGGNVLGGGDGGGALSPGGVDETVPRAPAGAQTSDTSGGTSGDDAFEFTKFVSKDVQDMWTTVFQQSGKTYARAPVVTFTSGTATGCGPASAQTGPFYCPVDHRVYIDLSFFQELSRRFGAPGDFAAAYVIAHEIGHHVQSQLGIEEQVREKQQDDPGRANVYSVQLELQADCFAGVWARSTYDRGLLDPGDIEEGLQAAAAVGDDRLGARSREQWTHGSSELRVKWFRTGYDSGNPGDCDTSGVDI
ncbi:KPN_02809 family neutral zinc metallopeptidase [Gaiella sp.]|uniref:KPN_02809 family neutral zinc metallopeptidase n=1 Tax=Gaiella sp. TaxID=2663207 RepID=UPI002E2FD5D4|nr:neutral zinc metallopeptidase [Gaiella sp.]HEX5584111.1 neutral zinc metallopeptidase [Gaiella sp.]